MNDRQNRTIICSILFLDIVEYSHQPVTEQVKLRNRFNELLFDALQSVAPNDRIILDTGDGAAVSFTGDPEDALFMALSLRDALADAPVATVPALKLRFGINLGPVKLVKDLNGHPNMLGDGINVAQRIMSFSEPGQVLVSRSYYEVVSRLSDEYRQLFHYEGPRTDKHVREHEVYAVNAERPVLQRPTPRGYRGLSAGGRIVDRIVHSAAAMVRDLYRRPGLSAAIFTIMVLAATLVLRTNPEQPDKSKTEFQALASKSESEPAEKTLPMIETVQAAAAKPVTLGDAQAGAAVKVAPSAPVLPVLAVAPPAAGSSVPATFTAPAMAGSVPAMKKATPGESVVVNIAVTPWGEVYVDDKKQGVSPPLNNVFLAPGQHRIEIKNTTFPSHIETITVKPGSPVTVRHRFAEPD